jgi:hypothetical protein
MSVGRALMPLWMSRRLSQDSWKLGGGLSHGGKTSLGMIKPMRHSCRVRPVLPPRSAFAGFRFPPDVIMVAVRWYLRYGLSYRDVEELLAERGIDVDHVTIYRWVQRFTLIDAAHPCRHISGDRWFIDETYVKVSGRWVYLYRAIDQFGQVIDVLVSEKRDLAATRRFFTRALNTTRVTPLRSSPTRQRSTRRSSMSWPRAPGITPSSTATTGSKPITAD